MNHILITIGRQYGSGGREIGEKLAKRLGIAYYDTLLLEKTAQSSGLSKSVLERYDERLVDKWLNFSPVRGLEDVSHLPMPLRAVLSQFEVIRKIGQTESAVIIGRCADHVLREQKNVLSVFIHAELHHRIVRVVARNNIDLETAKRRIRNTDKQRASYYNYYTDKEWGAPDSYHVSLDSGMFGIDGVVDLLESSARLFSQVRALPKETADRTDGRKENR